MNALFFVRKFFCKHPLFFCVALVSGIVATPLYAKEVSPTPNPASQHHSDSALKAQASEEEKDLPLLFLTNQIVFQVLSAELALQRGQPATAYKTYLALMRETSDPRMAQRATEIAVSTGSSVEALVAAGLWRKHAPHSRRAAQVEGILLILNGQLEEAQPLIKKELANTPAARRASAVLSLQSLIARSPDPLKGLQFLKTLLKDDQDLPEAEFALARQYLAANQPEAAHQALKKTLALKPSLTEAALLLAQLGPIQRQEAIASLQDFVESNPEEHAALLVLAQLYIADGKLNAAENIFQRYAKSNPSDLTPLLAIALIELQQKHYSRAENYLQRYIRSGREALDVNTHANMGQAYLYLAQIAVERKKYALAEQHLSKIRSSNPRYFAAQIAKAEVLAKMGKFDAAQTILKRLRSPLASDQALIALTSSSILFEAQRYTQAEAELAKANRRFANEPTLLYTYAMAAEKNGHYTLMESLLNRVIELQPDNPNAYNALGFSLADRNVRLNEAYKWIQRASELAPKDPYIMDSLGWVRYRQGHFKQAAKILKQAYRIQPQAEIGAHLGEVLWMQGKQNAARQIWQAAQKLDPQNETLKRVLKRFPEKKIPE